MERSLFGFILRYSKSDQLRIVPFVLATMVVYYLSLDLPKTIINEAIQGGRFQDGATATPRDRVSKAWCRRTFNALWQDRQKEADSLDRRSGNEVVSVRT